MGLRRWRSFDSAGWCVAVNHDGLNAVGPTGERGFPGGDGGGLALVAVYVDVLSELEELDAEDQAFVAAEIARLTDEIRSHRASVSALSSQLDKLESICRRPTLQLPSSGLQGG